MPFRFRPVDLIGRLAVITASASITLASPANPSPLTRPAFMQALTTASNTWRNKSLEAAVPIDPRTSGDQAVAGYPGDISNSKPLDR